MPTPFMPTRPMPTRSFRRDPGLRIRPSVWDRLTGEMDEAAPLATTVNLDKLKESVARDVEALLNSRNALGETAERSVLGFGVRDFVGRILSRPEDRQYVADCLARAIAAHESRLRNVRVEFRPGGTSVNALTFAIRADLLVHPAHEVVSFDAVLQPSLSQFAVSRGGSLHAA